MELKGKLAFFTDTNWLVYTLFVVYGMSSWIGTNGMWVEMPVVVQGLPEGWHLPSYMTVAIQVANIGPLIYVAASSRFPNRRLEVPVSYAIIGNGMVSYVFLAFLWRTTTYIAGAERSIVLIVLQFALALTDCTSTVAYLPFLYYFKTQYLTSFYVGEGFGAVVPSLIGMIQGAGTVTCDKLRVHQNSSRMDQGPRAYSMNAVYQEPVFSVQIYFFVLSIFLPLSGISLTLLNNWSYCTKEYAETSYYITETKCKVKVLSYDSIKDNRTAEEQQDDRGLKMKTENRNENGVKSGSEAPSDERTMPKIKIWIFFFLITWLSFFMFGFLQSIQTFSCLPYGIESYHLMVTLKPFAYPISSFVAMFLKMRSLRSCLLLSLLSTGLCGYIISTAVAGTEHPMYSQGAGSAILIICWVLATGIINYTRVSMAIECSSEGKMTLMWTGAWSLIGSVAGAIAGFCLVNFTDLVEEVDPCL